MLATAAAFADEAGPKGKEYGRSQTAQPARIEHLKPEEETTDGSVTIAGSRIDYEAVAGTLVVDPKGWDDTPKIVDQDAGQKPDGRHHQRKEPDCRSINVLCRLFQKSVGR